jgi:hypothetical protein
VKTTVVGGELLVDEGRHLRLDAAQAVAEGRRAAAALVSQL